MCAFSQRAVVALRSAELGVEHNEDEDNASENQAGNDQRRNLDTVSIVAAFFRHFPRREHLRFAAVRSLMLDDRGRAGRFVAVALSTTAGICVAGIRARGKTDVGVKFVESLEHNAHCAGRDAQLSTQRLAGSAASADRAASHDIAALASRLQKRRNVGSKEGADLVAECVAIAGVIACAIQQIQLHRNAPARGIPPLAVD